MVSPKSTLGLVVLQLSEQLQMTRAGQHLSQVDYSELCPFFAVPAMPSAQKVPSKKASHMELEPLLS